MNVHRYRGKGILTINIPIGNTTYTFLWYVGGTEYEHTLKYVTPQNVSIISNENIKQKLINGKQYAIICDDDYVIKAALCGSQYDKKNFLLNIEIEDINGSNIILDPNKIVASFAKGQTVEDLKKFVFTNEIYNINNHNVIYLNIERRHDNGILVINIPVGDNTYTFQWHVGDIKSYR